MKLTIVLLTVAFLQVHANAVSQSVTISGKNLSLKKVFSIIEQQTGYVVLSNKKDMEATNPVTLSVFDIPLQELLTMLLRDQPVNYRFDGTTIVLSRKPAPAPIFSLYETGQPVNGRVADSTGRGIQGASVKLMPGNKGTTTNENGFFGIPNVEAGTYTLVISYVGHEEFRTKVNVQQNSQPAIPLVILKRAATNLGIVEVISTGYQTLPRERATGAFTTVSHELLSTRVEPNLLTRLEGLVPGVISNKGSVNIRGIATLYGNRSPLFVVDGFPYEGDINYLNPDDILNVTVMKDAAAASIYGTRAANGVISITTRLGSARQTRINFNSTVFITPKPDVSYLQLMNSSEVVGHQQDLFNQYHDPYHPLKARSAMPKAIEALYQFEQGQLTQAQLDATLNKLKSQNGLGQVEDMMLQSNISHKHSLSVTGGNTVNQYGINLYYIGNRGHNIRTSSESINLGLNDKAQVFKWLTAELGLFANFSKNKYTDYYGTELYWWMPYEILKDENGNYVNWNYGKSQSEIDRLKNKGLLDESFNPLQQLDFSDIRGTSQYVRLQGGFNVKISKALNFDIKYQTERGSSYFKNFNAAESQRIANMVNDATQYDANGEVVKNIPDGGKITEVRGDSRSYTLRAQLNFDKRIGSDHQVTALAGTERRAVVGSSTQVQRFGYNDNNLQFRPINYDTLSNLTLTEAVDGTFKYQYTEYNNFQYTEDRYVSFYGNVGYNFKGRYNLTGSVRVDDSNLFGTDPRYRHLPLWSVGASWRISDEDFMGHLGWLNNLNLRATYGMGGNIARQVGPFLQASSAYFYETDDIATTILNPPNRTLRWERTTTTNFGFDYGILKNRISGSFDYYIRNTSDLLGLKKTDPTNAFTSALINYGSVTNKGFEIGLNTVNIDNKQFNWSTRISFTKNKNKMTEIAPTDQTYIAYVDGYGTQVKGYSMNALFNFRSAGLDPTNGTPMVYDKDGKVVTNYDQTGSVVANMTDVNALVYAGTMDPTYTLGVMNTVRYNRFTLTVMVVANGGNVFRDAVPMIINNANFSRNQDKRVLNYWKKPGDEKIPGIIPSPDLKNKGGTYLDYIWYSTDANTLKADFVKVRNIGLSYDFASQINRFTKISSANLLLQVQNPFKWLRNDRDLDFEAYQVSTNGAERRLPVTPTYMIGVNLTF